MEKLNLEQLEVFFSISIDMFCISSFDGHFKKVNSAFVKTLGFSAEELCTKSYLDFIHPDDIEITKLEVEKQLKTGQSVFNFENRYRCSDGSYKILSWKSQPLDGLMYACAQDVTESKAAEQSLSRAKYETEMANRDLRAFSQMVAHDLRAPLRRMAGFSTILLEDHEDTLNSDGKDYLHRIIASSQKMEVLIEGLLNFSQFSHQKIIKQPVDLTNIAKAVVTELRRSAPQREVDFSIAPDVVAKGDALLLNLVITNLIGNAWKYSAKSKGNVKIEFGVSKNEDGKTTYFVRDNGAGFDMKYADKLFGMFQRLHSVAEFEGTGIGLATAQKIIQRHGGEIWAEGSPDKGATFFFTI